MGKIFDRGLIGIVVWVFISMLYNVNELIVNQIGFDTWQQTTLYFIYIIVLVYITGFICEKIGEKLNKN